MNIEFEWDDDDPDDLDKTPPPREKMPRKEVPQKEVPQKEVLLMLVPLQNMLRCWVLYAEEHRVFKQRMARALQSSTQERKKMHMRYWHAYAGEKMKRQDVMAHALQSSKQERQKMLMRYWRVYAGENMKRQNAMAHALQSSKQQRKKMLMRYWRTYAGENMKRQRAMNCAIQTFAQERQKMPVQCWRAYAGGNMKRQNAMAHALQSSKQERKKMHMRYWHAYAGEITKRQHAMDCAIDTFTQKQKRLYMQYARKTARANQRRDHAQAWQTRNRRMHTITTLRLVAKYQKNAVRTMETALSCFVKKQRRWGFEKLRASLCDNDVQENGFSRALCNYPKRKLSAAFAYWCQGAFFKRMTIIFNRYSLKRRWCKLYTILTSRTIHFESLARAVPMYTQRKLTKTLTHWCNVTGDRCADQDAWENACDQYETHKVSAVLGHWRNVTGDSYADEDAWESACDQYKVHSVTAALTSWKMCIKMWKHDAAYAADAMQAGVRYMVRKQLTTGLSCFCTEAQQASNEIFAVEWARKKHLDNWTKQAKHHRNYKAMGGFCNDYSVYSALLRMQAHAFKVQRKKHEKREAFRGMQENFRKELQAANRQKRKALRGMREDFRKAQKDEIKQLLILIVIITVTLCVTLAGLYRLFKVCVEMQEITSHVNTSYVNTSRVNTSYVNTSRVTRTRLVFPIRYQNTQSLTYRAYNMTSNAYKWASSFVGN